MNLVILGTAFVSLNCIAKVDSEPKPQFTSREQINPNPYFNLNENFPNQYNYQNIPNQYNQPTTVRYYEPQNALTEPYNSFTRYDPSSNQYYSNTFGQNVQSPYNPQGLSNTPPPNSPPVAFIPPREVVSLLTTLDGLASQQCTQNVAAQWEYETNINDITQLEAVFLSSNGVGNPKSTLRHNIAEASDASFEYKKLCNTRVHEVPELRRYKVAEESAHNTVCESVGKVAAQQRQAAFQRDTWEVLKQIDYRRISEPRFWRQLRYHSVVGSAALPVEEYDRYNRMISEMVAVYNSASICAYNEPFRCGLRLNPDLTLIMARSRDWDELQHTWVEWRRHTGQYIKELYDQLVDLTNEAAKLNNFTNAADMWNFPYESPDLELEVDEVWSQISPLYEQLHAYVRRKLRDLYGPEKISNRAPLPSHILGNMWAQSWSNIVDVTLPYPGKNFLDVTPNMQSQGYTPLTMLQLAEEFFISLNMSAMPPEFWAGSIITDVPDRIINCQPSAWDFCNGRDYRIKMCAEVNMKDFVSMHHEMAHIQYFLQYRDQPKVFRDGANPGFHEAIGEAIALSVGSPTHLQKLGLVQTSIDDVPLDLNYLFSLAMDKLPFLPFAFIMDKWRWDVFRKTISKSQFNCHWHSLRERYLGVKPPLLRSEYDFDPGSKYHIPANVPYIRYFFSTVMQFQLHRHLCRVAGQYDPADPSRPLHRCDIYRSKAAGNDLKEIMKYGSSLTWNDVLLRVTNENKLDGTAVRDFFRPLEEWLRNENLRTQEYPGWIYDGDYCKQSIETSGLYVRGGYYNHSSALGPNVTLMVTLLVYFLAQKLKVKFL